MIWEHQFEAKEPGTLLLFPMKSSLSKYGVLLSWLFGVPSAILKVALQSDDKRVMSPF
jgi:hypothetical protein